MLFKKRIEKTAEVYKTIFIQGPLVSLDAGFWLNLTDIITKLLW